VKHGNLNPCKPQLQSGGRQMNSFKGTMENSKPSRLQGGGGGKTKKSQPNQQKKK
jgi:hypothetical protein